jgi:choline-glycine betaine transporter
MQSIPSSIGHYHCKLFWRYQYLYSQGHYHCVLFWRYQYTFSQAVGIGIARITYTGNDLLMKEYVA